MTTRRRLTVRASLIGLVLGAVLVSGATAAAPPPENDAFASPIELEDETGEARVVNLGASKEPGEPDHAGYPGGRSVWFSWTAPRDGRYIFGTLGGALDTLLAVYTGGTVDALDLIAENDDATEHTPASLVSFLASSGTEYRIAVDGFAGKGGSTTLRWAVVPANDNFADAVTISGRSGKVAGTSVEATGEHGESYMGGSVWYRWTAPATGPFSFSTTTTRDWAMDTVLAAYTGGDVLSLELIAEDDDDPLTYGLDSRMLVRAVAGETYSIQFDTWDDQGRFVLAWRPVVFGTAGADRIVGSAESEEIRGGRGADVILGGGGDDEIFPQNGDDVALGEGGADRIYDLTGRDVLQGGPGADTLEADDFDRRRSDVVHGGTGTDRCLTDRYDRRRGCP